MTPEPVRRRGEPVDRLMSEYVLRGVTTDVSLSRHPSADSRYLCMSAWKSRLGDLLAIYGPRVAEKSCCVV